MQQAIGWLGRAELFKISVEWMRNVCRMRAQCDELREYVMNTINRLHLVMSKTTTDGRASR